MRFIRKNGRIIPIRDNKDKKSAILKGLGKMDRNLAKTGDVIAGASVAFGAAGAAIGARAKSFGISAAGIGLGALGYLVNSGFAAGRRMSASEHDRYAKLISSGKKIDRTKGIGEASQRAYRNAKYLERASGKQVNYFYKKIVK